MSIEETLAARQDTHGDFKNHADIAQELKALARRHSARLSRVEAEALEMILHKVARILAGDPHFADHWHDIAGYATLVERDLKA